MINPRYALPAVLATYKLTTLQDREENQIWPWKSSRYRSRLDEAFLEHLLVAKPQIGDVG